MEAIKTTALLLSLFAFADGGPALTAHPTAAEPFVLAAGVVPLPALVDRCAEYLGCNILLSVAEAEAASLQPVRLQTAVSTDRAGCEELLANMLHRSGLVLTQLDAHGVWLEVLATNGPRARELPMRAIERTPEEILAHPHLRVPVLTSVTLQHVGVALVTNALRPILAGPSGVTLGTAGRDDELLLCGLQHDVAQVIRLLRKCDRPQADGADPSASLPTPDADRAHRLRLEAAAEHGLPGTPMPKAK